jgi:two-component system CAI-1 autoinducer sensor kinase/phosphatase CqsS
MNHQIDMQIANARLLQLPTNFEMVDATKTVSDAVAAYPFPSEREKRCVKVTVHARFMFRSSTAQFSQVLDNLIKNALRSLMAADSEYQEGALSIEVMRQDGRGQVVVTDTGGGIDPALLPHIFKPFFSTHAGTGHGLGLAFCKQVIERAGGTIFVKSQIAKGASFMIEVPVEE